MNHATTTLTPTGLEPVGLSFVGASLSSPGAMEAHEHKLPKDLPLRPYTGFEPATPKLGEFRRQRVTID